MRLTESQKYLLNRLPSSYGLSIKDDEADPTEIIRARKLIEVFEGKKQARRDARKKKLERMLKYARESVYFKPANKALEIIKAFEAEHEADK